MACILKCYYDFKLSQKDKTGKNKKDVDKILIGEIHRIYKEEFDLDTLEDIRPNMYARLPPARDQSI